MPVNPPNSPPIRLALTLYLLIRGPDLYVVTVTAGVEEIKK